MIVFVADIYSIYIIDSTGKIINRDFVSYASDIHYRNARYFSEGLLVIETENGITMINNRFQKAFNVCFSDIGIMTNGLAYAKQLNQINNNYNGLYGFINYVGDFIIEPQYKAAMPFSDGLAAVQNTDSLLWGFISKTGELVIQFDYDKVYPFSEGVAVVYKKDSGYQVIDVRGSPVFSFPDNIVPYFGRLNNYLSIFKEGLLPVKIKEQLGYIDVIGNIVFKGDFKDIGCFSEGLAPFIKDKKNSFFSGYFNYSGKIVYVYKNGYVCNFNDNRALVIVVENGRSSKGFIIDHNWLVVGTTFELHGEVSNPIFNEGMLIIDYVN